MTKTRVIKNFCTEKLLTGWLHTGSINKEQTYTEETSGRYISLRSKNILEEWSEVHNGVVDMKLSDI